MNHAAGNQRARHDFRERIIDETIAPMLSFRPRIGEVDMDRAHRRLRNHVFQKVARFDAQQAHVQQTRAAHFAFDFPQATEQALHTEKVPTRMLRGPRHQKRTIPGAELDLQGLRRVE